MRLSSYNNALNAIQQSLDFGVVEAQISKQKLLPLTQCFQLQYTHRAGALEVADDA